MNKGENITIEPINEEWIANGSDATFRVAKKPHPNKHWDCELEITIDKEGCLNIESCEDNRTTGYYLNPEQTKTLLEQLEKAIKLIKNKQL